VGVLLFLHLLGAVLFIGNIVTAAFWKLRAYRTGNPAVIHHAAKNVMLADGLFTLPGILLILVSGALMADRAGVPIGPFNWLTLSLLLFALTGVIWAAALLPLQRSMIRHSERELKTGGIRDAHRRASMIWNALGTVAVLLPVAVLYLMIAKPF